MKYVLIILLLSACLIPSRLFAVGDGEIRKITFKGNKQFSSSELKEKISFAQSTWVSQKLMKKKITYYSEGAYEMNVDELKYFYQTEGFLNMEVGEPVVKLKGKKKKVELTFHITENTPVIIDDVEFTLINQDETREEFSTSDLLTRRTTVSAQEGTRFRDNAVMEDKEMISQHLVNRGYAYTDVTPRISVDTTENKASVSWEIRRGPLGYFGDVSITGTGRTLERIVRKQLAIKQGDIYSRSKLNKSQQQIYQLGTYRVATVKAQLSRELKDTIPVQITLRESPRTLTRVGVGYGREDQIRAYVDFTILNFPGGARRLHLFMKHSAIEPYRFEATMTQPAVFGPNSTLAISPFVKKVKEPSYELFNYGANLMLSQRFTQYISGSINPYYERVDLDTTSIYNRVTSGVVPIKNYSKSGVAVGLIFNNSRPQFDPAAGWSVALNMKKNTSLFNGKYPFFKYIFEVKNYQRINYSIVMASKVKIGSIISQEKNGMIPVEEKFFAGGSRSVRGWARQGLGPIGVDGIPTGGSSMMEISLEPRIKIYGPLSLVVFTDIGNVWENSNTFLLNELRMSAGAGLRFSTPIGPIGIDFARPIGDVDTKWQFHLNIGNSF